MKQIFSMLAIVMVAATSTAAPQKFYYSCKSTKNSDNDVTLSLIVGGSEAWVQMQDTELAKKGKLDNSYKPRANTEYVRYVGFGSLMDEEYGSYVLVQKTLLKGGAPLRNGKTGGFIKIQDRGEGFFSTVLLCTKFFPR